MARVPGCRLELDSAYRRSIIQESLCVITNRTGVGMDINGKYFRFVLLFVNCLLTFGSYFCYDMPSVLQGIIQEKPQTNCTETEEVNTNRSTTCCDNCLGLGPDRYNQLYTIFSWSNACVVIFSGYFIDRVGNRIAAYLYSGICTAGAALFALGATETIRNTNIMFPLMMAGRFLQGAANGSIRIVQDRVVAQWFWNKELAMGFGIVLSFSRLGSVLNFMVTQNLEARYGIAWALWIGAFFCVGSFLSSFVMAAIERHGLKQLKDSAELKTEKVRISDVKDLPGPYWLIVVAILFYYNSVVPFLADSSKFIQDKYNYTKVESAYMTGAVYDVSMLGSPFIGLLVDFVGGRGFMAIVSSSILIPTLMLLAYTFIHPVIGMISLGLSLTLASVSYWPSITIIVHSRCLGTAMGIAVAFCAVGIGLASFIVGKILGNEALFTRPERMARWHYLLLFILANALICLILTGLVNLMDVRKGYSINKRSKKLQKEVSPKKKDAKKLKETDSLLSS